MTKTLEQVKADGGILIAKADAALKDPPKLNVCGNCQFFEPTAGIGQGACHRNPPVVFQAHGGVATTYPTVDRKWWCGEFTLKD